MGRRALADDVYVGQEWCHRKSGQLVTIKNVYRKDGVVLVYDVGTMRIRDLKQFYYPRTIYIAP